MTSIVVTNVSGTVTLNGLDLPAGACRGVLTPATIDGDADIIISVNADGYNVPATYTEMGELMTPAVIVPEVSATISDALGVVSVVKQDERFPASGVYKMSIPLTVV